MSQENDSLSLYRELADRYDKAGQFSMRDRFLMLAADAAYQAGEAHEAEQLRQKVLRLSRHHMLRPYSSFAEAMAAPDVQTYLADLRANYPPETAARLLASMKGGPKPTAVEQTRPLDWTPGPAPANIPQTAPLVDPYKPAAGPSKPAAGSPAKPAWQPAVPFRLLEEPEEPPATTSTAKPLAQPLPGRKNPPPTLLEPPAAPVRPTAPVPLAPLEKRPAAAPPAPAPAARRPAARPAAAPPAGEATESEWLSVLLTGIAILAGVAVAAYTIARPFLPGGRLH